ncbi:hypothetical protein AC249_AIPGENE20616 [Exaiptasia diaphana]|nr:hypothetical protein AC249_AIPGENE20616 [Exaiptasia diaphana]
MPARPSEVKAPGRSANVLGALESVPITSESLIQSMTRSSDNQVNQLKVCDNDYEKQHLKAHENSVS